MTVPTPNCPHCGRPPQLLLDEGRQAFCGTPYCEVLAWNPTQTAEELEANRKDIDLDGDRHDDAQHRSRT